MDMCWKKAKFTTILKIQLASTVLMLTAAACEKRVAENARPKTDCFPDRYTYSAYLRENGGAGAEVRDTAIFVSGVSFPETYDWQKDTAFGNSGAELVLLRDGKEVLRLKCGAEEEISPDADQHHLVNGRLYTEYRSKSETVIKRDGKTLYSFMGRELLCGLILRDDEVHTLGRELGGEGLAYRVNGKIRYHIDKGKFFDSMTGNPFYRSGVLYEDEGLVCFSFLSEDEDGEHCILYKDGELEELNIAPKYKVLDIRQIGGRIHILAKDSLGTVLICNGKEFRLNARDYVSEACVMGPVDGKVCVFGTYSNGLRKVKCLWSEETGSSTMDKSTRIFPSDAACPSISTVIEGLMIRDDGITHLIEEGSDWYFPSFLVGQKCGNNFYLALNPCSKGSHPFIWKNGEKTGTEINGFLSAIEAVPL